MSYAIGAVFENAPNVNVSALSFHREGSYCVSCATDGSLQLIDAISGSSKKTIRCLKYGFGPTVYTHHDLSIIHADGKNDKGVIRYLSLYDNKYLRFFRGHSAPIASLAMCPSNDLFLSSCSGGDVILWDLGSPKSAAKLSLGKAASAPKVAVSPDALVFAVCHSPRGEEGVVRMFDVRNHAAGPFATEHIERGAGISQWTHLEFSADGELLLIATDGPRGHLVLDAFSGQTKCELNAHCQESRQRSVVGATFSADGKTLFSGSPREPSIYAYTDFEKNTEAPLILKGHAQPVAHLKYSPKFEVLASAGAHTALWLPT